MRRQPPFSRRSMDFFLKDNLYDASRAVRDLGFEAQVSLRDGLKLTLARLNESNMAVSRPSNRHRKFA
jgi:nucleoside-diphosphate-sugar epimerase